jgi:hypothetical protein
VQGMSGSCGELTIVNVMVLSGVPWQILGWEVPVSVKGCCTVV